MKLLACIGFFAAACASGAERHASARLQIFRYQDSSGLSVSSDGVEVQQPLPGGVSVQASGLVEEIQLPGAGTPDDGGGGHQHLTALARARPDVVTSASSIASSGGPSQKRRVEGNGGVAVSRRAADVPIDVAVLFRVSQEPDYRSLSGSIHLSADLLQRNVTVAGFVGYGSDQVSPLTKPQGEDALWPARHQRVNGGFSISQLLTPELVLSGGASLNYQSGRLANPYRRALVHTTLFAESVPGGRVRGTAFARLVYWLLPGTAIHLRQGVYADDWGVKSLVPELTLARELGTAGLFLARGRFYLQSPASFYRPAYDDVAALMSGDIRLGHVREWLVGADLRWTFFGDPGTAGALEARASYDRSWIAYPDVGIEVHADIFSVAIGAAF